jgi:DNA ligase-1
MIKEFPKLYKRSSTGKALVWWMEVDGDRFRTHSGQLEGAIVTSEWTIATGKNLGKVNETTPFQQAVLEVEAIYTKKVEQGKYHNLLANIDSKPKFFSPMLAQKLDVDRINGAFYIQPKFNGVRCISDNTGLWSRNGKQFVNMPHIEEALNDFHGKFGGSAILDGEAYNHEYNDRFQTLMSAIRKGKPDEESIKRSAETVKYYLYDFPSHPGIFEERWTALQEVYDKYFYDIDCIELSTTHRSRDIKTAHGLHERNKKAGYEGSIIRLNTKYENKRTYSLMKYKDFLDDEFEIVSVNEGKGNWSGAAKSVTLKLPTGVTSASGKDTFDAGVKGDREFAEEMLRNKSDYVGKLATIVYQELSEYGVPIFPIFHSVRDYE